MITILYSLLAFAVAMMILITVHEFGHFLVARLLGVKVLRFSIGFGKPIIRWSSKSGTEYVLALFPIGGYIKMVDEREDHVPPDQLSYAFNRQPVLTRIAIVAAGPLFNILFAIFAYWLMFVIGTTSLAPIIGKIQPNSIAAHAGLKSQEEIVAVGNTKTSNWQQVNLALMPYVGNKNILFITVIHPKTSSSLQRSLDIATWQVDDKQISPIEGLGITPYMPLIPPEIAEITPGQAADKAGMKAGDRILKLNDKEITDWLQFVDYVKSHPQQSIQVTLKRANKTISIYLTPSLQYKDSGERIGFIGAKVKSVILPTHLLRHERYSALGAILPAIKETGSMIVLSLIMIWKLIAGYVSLHTVSGPVGIAQGAGISASLGIATYLSFLALISISLGVLNFLPVPILDGGYLFYYLAEIIRGKPFSEKVESVALKIGLFLLISLMVLAFYNDMTRLVG